MKHFLAFLLILSVLSFQLSEMIIYVSFKINQGYIAKNLCVEKDIESSTCKGCCQLKKKLEDQQQKKEALPGNQIEKLDINFCTHQQNKLLVYHPNSNVIRVSKKDLYRSVFNGNVFHPPQV